MDPLEEFFEVRARRLRELTAQLLRRTAELDEEARRRERDDERRFARTDDRRRDTRGRKRPLAQG